MTRRWPIPEAFNAIDIPPLAPPRTLRTVLDGAIENVTRPFRLATVNRMMAQVVRDVGVLTVQREREWRSERMDAAEITTVILRNKIRRYFRLMRDRDELEGRKVVRYGG